MNPNDKRVIKTKLNIKKVFLNLLRKKTFEKITVTEISEIALISKTTFYLHYDSKYELAEECIHDFLEEINTNLKNTSAIFENLSSLEQLDHMVKHVDSVVEQINILNKISINNFYLYDKIRDTIAEEVSIILSEQGVNNQKVNLMAYQISSMIIDFIRYKSSTDKTATPYDYVRSFLEIIAVYKDSDKIKIFETVLKFV